MPEGPEIRRAADQVSEAVCNHTIERIQLNLPAIKPFEKQLQKARVVSVDTHGKAMLTRFSNGLTLYSHNQLYGRWMICDPNQAPDTKRQLRVAIRTKHKSALLYSASEIEVLGKPALATHPFLSTLGPDVLLDSTTDTTVLKRLRDSKYKGRQLGAILTNQQFVSGLGNYLRCEILFCAGLHPTTRAKDCSESSLSHLAQLIIELPRQSYITEGITADLARARQLMEDGATFEDARFHLFRREGKPCYRCDTPIEKYYAGSQACYVCPQCQSPLDV